MPGMADRLVTGYSFTGPKRGADRAVLLAHGAGSDREGAALVAVATALADAGVPALRFDYPYRSAGRRAPDRPPVLESATREAAAELARRSGLAPERLVLGGRSMGGRVCSLVGAARPDADPPVPALGLVLLGYPLHPMGKPEQRRDTHFRYLTMPVLFASGTRDSLAPRAELTRSARKVKGPVTMHWIETADHGFRPLKSSGRSGAAVLDDVAAEVVRWVTALEA
jgi:uncharacterized protein